MKWYDKNQTTFLAQLLSQSHNLALIFSYILFQVPSGARAQAYFLDIFINVSLLRVSK